MALAPDSLKTLSNKRAGFLRVDGKPIQVRFSQGMNGTEGYYAVVVRSKKKQSIITGIGAATSTSKGAFKARDLDINTFPATKSYMVKMPLSGVYVPKGKTTCCGRRVFIFVHVQITINGETYKNSKRVGRKFRC